MAKRFVKYAGTKEQFAAAKDSNVLLSTKYEKSIVLIAGGTSGVPCIYTRGKYINDAEEFLRSIPYVKGVTDAEGKTVVTGGSAAVIPFKTGAKKGLGANKGTTNESLKAQLTEVTVDQNGVQITLTDGFVDFVNTLYSDLSTAKTDLGNKTGTGTTGTDAFSKIRGLRSDLGNKNDTPNASGSAFAQIAKLAADVAALGGDSGSIATQIEAAITAALGDGGDIAMEIENQLDGLENSLMGAGLDGQTDGKVKSAIDAALSGTTVTISSAAGTGNVSQVYTIKQGTTTIGTINIPKDQFLKSAALVKGTWASDKFTESATGTGKAIKLVMNIDGDDSDSTVDVLYINVADLVDVYTAQDSAAEVQVAISDSNVISATIVNGSVNANKLASNAVTTAKILDGNVTEAKLASNAVTTDKINDSAVTTGKIANSAVETVKIKDGNVTYDKLSDDVKTLFTPVVDYSSTSKSITKADYNSIIASNSAIISIGSGSNPIVKVPAVVDNSGSSLTIYAMYDDDKYTISISRTESSGVHSYTVSKTDWYELEWYDIS